MGSISSPIHPKQPVVFFIAHLEIFVGVATISHFLC